MTIESDAGAPSLFDRAKAILMRPRAEWDRIAAESADVPNLYLGYVAPLALLAGIANFIGTAIVGTSLLGDGHREPMAAAGIHAAMYVLSTLIAVYVLALVTNALAPAFGSVKDRGQAHKLAVYGATATLLGGVFAILPPIASAVGLVAVIYALVVIYLGLPRLMKTPDEKRPGYFATIIGLCLVLGVVISTVLSSALSATGVLQAVPNYTFGRAAPVAAETQAAAPTSIDLEALRRHAAGAEVGAHTAVEPARLEAQLPQSLPGGFSLASASSSAGAGFSQAEGLYRSGEAELRVTVVQTSATGSFIGAASGTSMQEISRGGDGYARTQTIDGRVYAEDVSTAARSASYGVIGRRVAVWAAGTNGVTLDQARAAVETIGVPRLEREFGG